VIISHLRSGTHLLRTLLESHPEIVCQTEVFNSDNPNLPYPLSTPTLEILDQWVFRDFPTSITCVGFVLQAYHPWGLKAFPGIRENPDWADIWPMLENMPGLRIIHLHRENLLRRHLSHVMARSTGNWHHWDNSKVAAVSHLEQPPLKNPARNERPRVKLDADKLRLDFEEIEQLHQQVTDRFKTQNYFPLGYEQLCTEPGVTAKALLQFLEVTEVPLHAAVSKLEDRSLSDSIENYDELKQAFADSRWKQFF